MQWLFKTGVNDNQPEKFPRIALRSPQPAYSRRTVLAGSLHRPNGRLATEFSQQNQYALSR